MISFFLQSAFSAPMLPYFYPDTLFLPCFSQSKWKRVKYMFIEIKLMFN